MVPVAPSRMVLRILRCPSKQGASSLCCLFSCLFCLLDRGNVYTVFYFDQMLVISFIASGNGLAAPSASLRATPLTGNSSCMNGRPSLTRVCWVPYGARLLGRSNCDCTRLAKSPPLLRIKTGSSGGKSQVGSFLSLFPLKGVKCIIMPCCIIVVRLPTSACASRHAPCVPCTVAFIIISPVTVPINNHFIYGGMPDSILIFTQWQAAYAVFFAIQAVQPTRRYRKAILSMISEECSHHRHEQSTIIDNL
jgi:hypothetical protein